MRILGNIVLIIVISVLVVFLLDYFFPKTVKAIGFVKKEEDEIIKKIKFPICMWSLQKKTIKKIQNWLNDNKKIFVTPYLVIDGYFGPKTELELENLKGVKCVSETLYKEIEVSQIGIIA